VKVAAAPSLMTHITIFDGIHRLLDGVLSCGLVSDTCAVRVYACHV